MTTLKRSLLMVPVLALALSVFSVTVFARGTDSGTDSSGVSGKNAISSSSTSSVETEHATENEAQKEQAKEAAKELRDSARAEFEKMRAQNKEVKHEDRLKKCENRKHGLETKITNLNNNGQKHLDHFSAVLVRALAFKTEKNLNPDGFAELQAAAEAAQAKAQTSVSALSQLTPTVDCQKDTVASDVAAFRQAAEQARNDLKDFKSAVKDVLKSLEVAKENGEQ